MVPTKISPWVWVGVAAISVVLLLVLAAGALFFVDVGAKYDAGRKQIEESNKQLEDQRERFRH